MPRFEDSTYPWPEEIELLMADLSNLQSLAQRDETFKPMVVAKEEAIRKVSTFACERFDDGSSYLKMDYSIDCTSPTHILMTFYAFVMIIIYPIGTPLYFVLQVKLLACKLP